MLTYSIKGWDVPLNWNVHKGSGPNEHTIKAWKWTLCFQANMFVNMINSINEIQVLFYSTPYLCNFSIFSSCSQCCRLKPSKIETVRYYHLGIFMPSVSAAKWQRCHISINLDYIYMHFRLNYCIRKWNIRVCIFHVRGIFYVLTRQCLWLTSPTCMPRQYLWAWYVSYLSIFWKGVFD